MNAPTETPEEDKVWLEGAILEFMAANMKTRIGFSESDIVGEFAPTFIVKTDELIESRPTFGNRERKVRKKMTVAAIKRLLKAGRLGVAKTYEVRRKGRYEPETVVLYKPLSILDALAEV